MSPPSAIATASTTKGGASMDPNNNMDLNLSLMEDEDEDCSMSLTLNENARALAQRKTRAVQCLRWLFLAVLLSTGAVVSTCVHLHAHHDEHQQFGTKAQDAAVQVVDKFHVSIEQSLARASLLSATMTSHAQRNNHTFPHVTMPDFELLASHLRTSSGSHIVHWMPFVQDQERAQWEDHAMEQRFQIDESHQRDAHCCVLQNEQFEITSNETGKGPKPQPAPAPNNAEVTTLQDGTGHHPKTFSMQGHVPRDEAEGAGPFVILWQRRRVCVQCAVLDLQVTHKGTIELT